MPAQPSTTDIDLLRKAYAAFNARHIDAALATMTPDVEWPRAFKGGFVQGHRAVAAYWTEQWAEIDPHVEPERFERVGNAGGQIRVRVHQLVKTLAGEVLADAFVGHVFTIEQGLIRKMDVVELPSSAETSNAAG